MISRLGEAATRGVLQEKVFLKISQNLQENTWARASFLIKLQGRSEACNFSTKETLTQVFSCEFCHIFENTSLRATVSKNFSINLMQFNYCRCRLNTAIIGINVPTNLLHITIRRLRSCLCEKNHPTHVRRLTWVRSRQNGIFHFVKTNSLYENWFAPPRQDLTST